MMDGSSQLRNLHTCIDHLKKNKNILLRGDDGSRFDPSSMDLMASKRVQPFIPKADNSTNNQPNENGENTKLKALYNRQISN